VKALLIFMQISGDINIKKFITGDQNTNNENGIFFCTLFEFCGEGKKTLAGS